MKKKLTVATMLLATSLIAAGCDSSSVDYKENENGQSIIFTLKDGDKVIEEYTADDLLKELQDNSSATSRLYSEISRKVFAQYAKDTLDENKIEDIRSDAEDEVEDFKNDCSTNAKSQGVDYDTYLEQQLASRGVETLEELEALEFDEGLKEEVLEDYVKNDGHYNYFLQEYLKTYTPFQVKHVLVAANTADTKFKDGTMTTDNARKLLNVMNRFKDGESFASVAELTDDTSSKDNGGIMPFNQAQDYVAEFRFATYAQEIFKLDASNVNADEETLFNQRYKIAKDLHIVNVDDKVEEAKKKEEFKESELYSVYENGMTAINFSDIMKLNDKVTKDMAGAYNYFTDGTPKGNDIPTIAEQPYEMNVNKYNDDGELNPKYYEEYELERNQIFNKTLNSHKVQYIKLDDAENAHSTEVYIGKEPTKVLADEDGNPIFFALASTGIHFMAMVWNSYNPTSVSLKNEVKESLANIILENNTDITKPSTDDGTGANLYNVVKEYYEDKEAKGENGLKEFDQELNNAYFTLYNNDDKDLEKYKYTYIGRNNAYISKSSTQSNSNSLLSDITSYASSLEYYLFNAIVFPVDVVDGKNIFNDILASKHYDISFYDASLKDAVKDYVQDTISSTDDSFTSSVESAAETYGSKLAREQEVKDSMENWMFENKKA